LNIRAPVSGFAERRLALSRSRKLARQTAEEKEGDCFEDTRRQIFTRPLNRSGRGDSN
jgi:hypothetical protein